MAARRGAGTERAGGTRSNQLLRSVHEGWAYHFTPQSRSWMKRWLVLDGSRLVVFSTDKSQVVVSLNLGQGTKVKDVMLQRNVYGLDIELTTMKGMTESRIDYLGFSTPNECDLWKAYIVGFSYGIIPENLNLLPGQLKDVREAVMDIGLAPPPLPLPNKRPSLKNVVSGMSVAQQPSPSALPTHVSSPNLSESPYSDINISTLRSSPLPSGSDEEESHKGKGSESQVLQQLDRRCADLALKALEKGVEPSKRGIHGSEQLRSQQSFTPFQQQAAWNLNDSVRGTVHPLSSKKIRPPVLMNNNELPPFYDDPERNKIPPPWFMNCTREIAEMILTAARNYGNLFMRPSYNNNASETYVISMRRDLPGGLELRHYAVYRTPEGFKLDVVDKHSPMSCLSDVMNFFIHYVGPSAQPLNSQDVDRQLGGIVSAGSVVSPGSGVVSPSSAVVSPVSVVSPGSAVVSPVSVVSPGFAVVSSGSAVVSSVSVVSPGSAVVSPTSVVSPVSTVVSPKPLSASRYQFLGGKDWSPLNEVKSNEIVSSSEVEENGRAVATSVTSTVTSSSEKVHLNDLQQLCISKSDELTSPVGTVTQGKENVSVIIVKSVPDAAPAAVADVPQHHGPDAVAEKTQPAVSSSLC